MNSVFRSNRSQIFFKIGVLKNFAIFTWKHLHWSLFIIKFQANLIVGTPTPLAPLIKGGRVGPSKNWVTWGGGGEVLRLFYYLTVSYIDCIWGRKVKFDLLHFDSSVFWVNHARFSSQVFILLKHCMNVLKMFWCLFAFFSTCLK